MQANGPPPRLRVNWGFRAIACKWQKQVASHGGAFPGSGQRAEPMAELARLKRELARVTEERDILKKAAAYFARESRWDAPLFRLTNARTLKNELIHHRTYQGRDEASREIFAFIEGFYNRQRLHQSLAYLSPLEFERPHQWPLTWCPQNPDQLNPTPKWVSPWTEV
jgi:integrase-like protein